MENGKGIPWSDGLRTKNRIAWAMFDKRNA